MQTSKNRKIYFRLTMNRRNVVSRKTMKKIRLRKFSVRIILDTYLQGQSSRFRARVAKGRSAFRDRIAGVSLESKIVYRGLGFYKKVILACKLHLK